MWVASRNMTASPLFMSEEPTPCSRSPSRRLGRLSATGTVSRCPAMTTRRGRPRRVRAMTASPSRSTSRWDTPRSAASTSSASRVSLPDTDWMSIMAAVSASPGIVGSSTQAGYDARVPPPVAPPVRASLGSPAVTSYRDQPAAGLGLATYAADGTLLDCYFPQPGLGEDAEPVGALEAVEQRHDAFRDVTVRPM